MEKLEIVRTKQYIADHLQAAILSGHLVDGQKLVQNEIAEQMNVSRIPVREAFQQLEQSGFLVRMPGRHVCVCGLTPRRLRQLVQVFMASLTVLLQDLPCAAGEYLEGASSEEEFFARLEQLIENPHITVQLMRSWRDYIRLIAQNRMEERRCMLRKAATAVKERNHEMIQPALEDFSRLLMDEINLE